ncbi:hypothetical protein CRENBAI_000376 [Crenichthys baileyi]|uniref:Uncharacterized protein n=1 Tax=Crenichthys baileyi TaxID=28760 RepID=A0AAV9SGE5_9TELE
MNASISSKARAVPVISVDKIKPLIENVLLSISLDQSMDLALGQPDGDTKSKLKELLLNLVEEYSTFVLYNIRKRHMRSGDVVTVVGDTLLKSFADVVEINGKTHAKSFECFHELFVKQIKEKYHHGRYRLLPVIPEEPELEEATAEGTDGNNFILENQESELKMKRKSELKMVEKFVSEELSEIMKEKESELNIMEEFISEELSEVTEEKEISEKQRFKIPGISEELGDHETEVTAVQNFSTGVKVIDEEKESEVEKSVSGADSSSRGAGPRGYHRGS